MGELKGIRADILMLRREAEVLPSEIVEEMAE